MAIFIDKPWLALIATALFAAFFILSKNKLTLAAGAFWFLYCLYEYAMKYRILCTGECNIRIDLFIVYPILLLASLAALLALLRSLWNGRRVIKGF